MRRMQIITEIFSTIPGTTSAHAENTCAGEVFSLADENYLRVRGEYDDGLPNITAGQELPPRTRRIQLSTMIGAFAQGTTSAYAENTRCMASFAAATWNYLRVRGEYYGNIQTPRLIRELPPRTRRIQRIHVDRTFPLGTTSAYAENTCLDSLAHRRGRNYLRVRGEYLGVAVEGLIGPELPPRTRRIRPSLNGLVASLRTTSAYAENTLT